MKKCLSLLFTLALTLSFFACKETPSMQETWARSRVNYAGYEALFPEDVEKLPSENGGISAHLLRFHDAQALTAWIDTALAPHESEDNPYIRYFSEQTALENARHYANEAFFEEYSLFVMVINVGSGSCRYSEPITVCEKEKVEISLTVTYPNPYTEDMATQLFFLPIPKASAHAETVSLHSEILFE